MVFKGAGFLILDSPFSADRLLPGVDELDAISLVLERAAIRVVESHPAALLALVCVCRNVDIKLSARQSSKREYSLRPRPRRCHRAAASPFGCTAR